MNRVEEGGRLRVGKAETFVVERRGLGGSGYQTRIEVPNGVQHLETRTKAGSGFGAKPFVEERFLCSDCGTFAIRFVSGRPWQDASRTTITTVDCH